MAFNPTPKFKQAMDRLTIVSEQGYEADLQREFRREMVELGSYERINNLYRIRPKRIVPNEPSRTIFFRFNPLQNKYWEERSNRDIILKSRQQGFTTIACIEALDMALWVPGVNTAIMAHVLPNVKEYFTKSKQAFRWFQKDWGQYYPVTEQVDNVHQLKIKELGSSLLVCTEAKGLSLDYLHVAEAAFVEEDRISESMEAVPLSSHVVLESTPDTASGLFYKIYESSKHGGGIFKTHFFPWWMQYPEEEDIPNLIAKPDFRYTDEEEQLVADHGLEQKHILWRRLKISECGGDEGEFMRKYPQDDVSCFLSGSSCVFPMETQMLIRKQIKAPIFAGDLSLVS